VLLVFNSYLLRVITLCHVPHPADVQRSVFHDAGRGRGGSPQWPQVRPGMPLVEKPSASWQSRPLGQVKLVQFPEKSYDHLDVLRRLTGADIAIQS